MLITDFLQKRKHPVPCRRWEDNDGKRKKRLWFIMQQRMQHAGKAVTEYRIEKQDRDGIMPEARESYDKLSVILICLNEEKDPGERGSLYRFLNTLLSFR